MTHSLPHPLAGKTVRLTRTLAGRELRVEDWWDRVAGKSWTVCDGNTACLAYAIRGAAVRLPIDDEVVYGKVGFAGVLVHVSELGEPIEVGS